VHLDFTNATVVDQPEFSQYVPTDQAGKIPAKEWACYNSDHIEAGEIRAWKRQCSRVLGKLA